jgi:tRNA nucleotidyltransferase/poly(A) polymerase
MKSFQQFIIEQKETEVHKDVITLDKGFVPPSSMKSIIQAFKDSGNIVVQHDLKKTIHMPKKKLYLVGGAVRDLLLGHTPHDFDLATDALPEQIFMILESAGFQKRDARTTVEESVSIRHDLRTLKEIDRNAHEVMDELMFRIDHQLSLDEVSLDDVKDAAGKSWDWVKKTKLGGYLTNRLKDQDKKEYFVQGTDGSGKAFVVGAVVGSDTYEIATFRIDAKMTAGERKSSSIEVDFTNKVSDDASRRDFTINAMYIELTKPSGENKKLHDPHHGYGDLKNNVVKTVGVAEDRFEEDKLRVMRAIRFHCRHSGKETLHDDIEAAIPKFKDLEGVSVERIREEFIKGINDDRINAKCFIGHYKRLKMLKTVFPSMDFDHDTASLPNDHVLATSWILRGNTKEEVKKVLSKMKWSNVEKDSVSWLIDLLRNWHTNKVVGFLRTKPVSLSDKTIKKWAEMASLDAREINEFLKHHKESGGKSSVPFHVVNKEGNKEVNPRLIDPSKGWHSDPKGEERAFRLSHLEAEDFKKRLDTDE